MSFRRSYGSWVPGRPHAGWSYSIILARLALPEPLLSTRWVNSSTAASYSAWYLEARWALTWSWVTFTWESDEISRSCAIFTPLCHGLGCSRTLPGIVAEPGWWRGTAWTN